MLRSLVLRRAFHSTRCRPNFISELREVKDDFIRRKKGTKHANRKIRPVEDEEADKFEKLLEIINKSKKSTFSDPANRKMDLSGSNSHIYNTLMSDVRRRKQNRVKFADENWKKNYHKLQDEIFPNISDRKTKNSLIAEGISYSLKEAVISVESAGSSINVGDVVALSDDSTSFYIVVGIPKKITSPYYTYINKQGEIVFGTKDRIRLRFPQAIPQTYKILLESLVSLEVKWKNMAPVGYPDAEFSKSEPSLSTASKPSSLDDDLSMRDDDDLIISSASSQLLTNSDVLTYQVTQTARELYSDALRDLGISTSNEIPSITKKLEYLHKFLQIDESGEVINSPRTISIFELMEYLTRLSLNENGSSVLVNQKK